jgi:DNA-binding transcriptional ArsR family regulator
VARYLAHPREEEIDLAKVMQALSDPVRLRLVEVLGDGEYHSCRAEEFDAGVHKSTLSHHFRILRQSGVTVTRLDGRNHWVRLRTEALNNRFPHLIDAVVNSLRAGAATSAGGR